MHETCTKKLFKEEKIIWFAKGTNSIHTLTNLLKGGASGADSLQTEKAALDASIQKNLNYNKTGADVKMNRHWWLYKQSNQLKDIIENKPQKVIVENTTGTARHKTLLRIWAY
ncbi:hypothetical protein niasHT_012517 [Heterodera trifolii]|uniref:Uncharacterized protein n=1 Tax=Heterodera trifolii TaxID=157864 RepID=A0ABD2LCT0_9BILA